MFELLSLLLSSRLLNILFSTEELVIFLQRYIMRVAIQISQLLYFSDIINNAIFFDETY